MLVAATEARIVKTSSINGFWASLGSGVSHTAYSAAKFAIKGFSEALITDLRLNAQHVKVSVVMPGHIGTDIRRNSLKAIGRGDAIRQMIEQLSRDFKEKAPINAAQASAIILDGIRDDQWRILVGDDAHALDELVRTDPYHAYESQFIEPLVQQGHLG